VDLGANYGHLKKKEKGKHGKWNTPPNPQTKFECGLLYQGNAKHLTILSYTQNMYLSTTLN
jgi:hypothetical protein